MITFLPGRDELFRMRNADSFGDVFLRAVGVVLDVVSDSAHEECRLLADETDLPSECGDVEGSDVLVVDEDLPVFGLVEAHEKLGYCRFATA